MANMFNNSKLKSVVWSNGFGNAATNMSSMFYNASLPTTNFNLPDGFGSAATDMNNMFYNASLPTTSFDLPNGFGSVALNMQTMFRNADLPTTNFNLPDGFGSAATDMNNMFAWATIPINFSLGTGFGSVATNIYYMFAWASLNGDIDWSGTNLTNSTAIKSNIFIGVTWNGHFVLAQNQGSVDWLIDGTGADATNVKIKGS
jgi:hypothetical protein